MADLWFIRHFRTPWNAEGRIQGRRDIALDDPPGADDMAALARNRAALAGRDFGAIWSSPLMRPRQTAALHGFEAPELLPDLAELAFGAFEGRCWADLEAAHPGLWRSAPDRLPLGEPFDGFLARVARVIGRARARPGPPVLVFGHGTWAAAMLCLLEGRDPATMNHAPLMPNGTLLRLSPGRGRQSAASGALSSSSSGSV